MMQCFASLNMTMENFAYAIFVIASVSEAINRQEIL